MVRALPDAALTAWKLTIDVELTEMLNVLWILLSIGLPAYFVLWLVGCPLPGTCDEPFKGWNYARCTDPDDDKRRNRA